MSEKYNINNAFLDEIGSIGLRLSNADHFYLRIEPCAEKVIVFFKIDFPTLITAEEIRRLEDATLRDAPSNVSLKLIDDHCVLLLKTMPSETFFHDIVNEDLEKFFTRYERLMEQPGIQGMKSQ
jgi:hypothetical protein